MKFSLHGYGTMTLTLVAGLTAFVAASGVRAQEEAPADEAPADEAAMDVAPEPSADVSGVTEVAEAKPEVAEAKPEVAEAKPEVAEAKPLVGYDKGFFIGDSKGLFKLKIGATMQPQLAWESVEEHVEEVDDVTGEAVVLSRTDREAAYSFLIRRAELKLGGHAFSERVTYGFMADFGKGSVFLEDYYLDFALAPDVLHLRFGSWKRPFSRQQMTSSSKLELVDRSITDKAFGGGRDLGLMLHNDYERSPTFEWAVGVFNGGGNKPWFEGELEEDEDGNLSGVSSKAKFTNVPDRFHPMAVARLGFNYGKLAGYSEADLEGGPFRLGLGVSGIADFDSDDTGDSNVRGELDYIIKAAGFSTTGAVYVMSAQDGGGFNDQAFAAWGLHAQAGYVVKGHVQPVIRYAIVDWDGDDNNIQEVTGGLNVFIFKHNLKWQTDAGGILREHEAGGLTDYVVRSQVTLAF